MIDEVIKKEIYYERLANLSYCYNHKIRHFIYNLLYRYYSKKHIKMFENQ